MEGDEREERRVSPSSWPAGTAAPGNCEMDPSSPILPVCLDGWVLTTIYWGWAGDQICFLSVTFRANLVRCNFWNMIIWIITNRVSTEPQICRHICPWLRTAIFRRMEFSMVTSEVLLLFKGPVVFCQRPDRWDCWEKIDGSQYLEWTHFTHCNQGTVFGVCPAEPIKLIKLIIACGKDWNSTSCVCVCVCVCVCKI